MSTATSYDTTTPSGKPRLFVCDTCSRAFARLEHLKRHERSHTKEKPFVCGLCQRKFSRRDLLLRHAQKLHAESCDDAVKRLRRKSVKKRKTEDDRRASFSAASSSNYASRAPKLEQKFSTPQLNAKTDWLPEIPPLDYLTNDDRMNGYSFYEMPTSKNAMKRPNFPTVLSPLFENVSHDLNSANPIGVIDPSYSELEAVADLNASKRFNLPTGYSFYGNADQRPMNHSSSVSGTISPSLLDAPAPNMFLDKTQLFTPAMRSLVHHALAKYPFIGLPSPALPDNECLNQFVDCFSHSFLSHYPFIHRSTLNEFSMAQSAYQKSKGSQSDVKIDNEIASVCCLPLLIATIGAVVSNNKEQASNLYEASRRCIHVYLDTKKKVSPSENRSPLWLLQSLTLSVMYGLFGDNDISLNVIIRQVNALSSLIISTGLNRTTALQDFVHCESVTRTIFVVFGVSSLLSSLYNIVPSLKIDDMLVNLPCSDMVWECGGKDESVSFITAMNDFVGEKSLSRQNRFSSFALVCLQYGLHQFQYYAKNLDSRNSGCQKIFQRAHHLVPIQEWQKLGRSDSLLVLDSRLMNVHLLLKNDPLFEFPKLKEYFWLKKWDEMKMSFDRHISLDPPVYLNEKISFNLCRLASTSLEGLRMVFFQRNHLDHPKQGTGLELASIQDYSFGLIDVDGFSSKISLHLQALFDIFLFLVKFTQNFENTFVAARNFEKVSRFGFASFLQSDFNVASTDSKYQIWKMYFDHYRSIFRVMLNLEVFLKMRYNCYGSFPNLLNGAPKMPSNDFLRNEVSQFQGATPVADVLNCQIESQDALQNATNELTQYDLPKRILETSRLMFSCLYNEEQKFVIFSNMSDAFGRLAV